MESPVPVARVGLLTPQEDVSAPAATVVASCIAPQPEKPVARKKLVLRVFLLGLLVAVAVSVAGGLVAQKLAEGEAVLNASVRTDDIAVNLVSRALENGLPAGDRAAIRALDARVHDAVLAHDIARVKVWSTDGRIVYSDESRLIGQRFGLGEDERTALKTGKTEAAISDLSEPENRFERGNGPLLEVYRLVRTPDGTPLLFEVYYHYTDVVTSTQHIWLAFTIIIPASLLLLLVALLPLLNGLVRSVERAREEREFSLLKALDASDAERRRIAASVHDGPVQDLIGASYRVGAATAEARGSELEPVLSAAETAVRESIDGLRDMLVDLYPASLTDAGLATALGDYVSGLRSRGAMVLLRVDDDLQLQPSGQQLIFRVARELVANAVKHGEGSLVRMEVRAEKESAILTVSDDGPGFDAERVVKTPPKGHFGMRLLQDAVRESRVDATLTVLSAPGAGTTWRLVVS
jgi:two-component system NarL family sensor kinase